MGWGWGWAKPHTQTLGPTEGLREVAVCRAGVLCGVLAVPWDEIHL
jgi:hypothetical protein